LIYLHKIINYFYLSKSCQLFLTKNINNAKIFFEVSSPFKVIYFFQNFWNFFYLKNSKHYLNVYFFTLKVKIYLLKNLYLFLLLNFIISYCKFFILLTLKKISSIIIINSQSFKQLIKQTLNSN